MKKILLLMAIVLPFVLISCGDDKDEPSALEQQLIGGWNGQSETSSILHPQVIQYIFNADHTGRYIWQETPSPLRHGATSGGYDYTWKLKKNVLTITPNEGDDPKTFEISIENGILKMTQGIITYVLTKGAG